MVEVVKKGGTKEQFDKNKIKRSIEKAAIDADFSLEDIKTIKNRIINDISEESEKIGELNTTAIKKSIFNNLEESEPSIIES